MVALSILDLAFVTEGSTPADALHNSVDLARRAEEWGYTRFWLAEHHNMIGIASAATSVAIGYVAGGTTKIRVGAGGIMLPNHSPLVIAEQFGTLESLYPNRIDLGLGRAPGTDQLTLRALRRDYSSADSFPQDVVELQALLGPSQPGQHVQAVPGVGTNVPLWIFGFEPLRCAARGRARAALRVCFALCAGRAVPRSGNVPREFSAVRTVSAALRHGRRERDRRRHRCRSNTTVSRLRSRPSRACCAGARGKLQPPIDDIEKFWTPREKAQAFAHADVRVHRLVRYGARGARQVRRGYRGRRSHRCGRGLRSWLTCPLVRAARAYDGHRGLESVAFARRRVTWAASARAARSLPP